jgi:hypothetical protein
MSPDPSGSGAVHCSASCCQGNCDPGPTCRVGADPLHRAQKILDRAGSPSGSYGARYRAVLTMIVLVSAVAAWCERCETASAFPTMLGFVNEKDDRWGEIAGFACWSCEHRWEAPGAQPVYKGRLT